MEVEVLGETPCLSGQFVGETHTVLHIHKRTHWESAPEGSKVLWIVGEVTESWRRAEEVPLFPLRHHPHKQYDDPVTWVALP